MTYDDFINVLSNDTARILSENIENTLQGLLRDVSNPEILQEDHLKMFRNSVTVSVQLSLQIIFAHLDSLGMLDLKNLSEHFERPNLKLIKGGLSDNEGD